jgi:hypothetical protein
MTMLPMNDILPVFCGDSDQESKRLGHNILRVQSARVVGETRLHDHAVLLLLLDWS